MTQKELIEFCKENDPDYNKNASFKENFEPMWSIPKGIGGIGITESEFKNGFYVEINTKGRKGFEYLEGRVFYFRNLNPSNATGNMYNTHWKKYFVPLNDMMGWSREIVKDSPKPILTEFEQKTPIVEEFPIVKESVETWYRKRGSRIKINNDPNGVKLGFEFELEHEIFTKEEFSDLVDLMIEARKDLLK